MKIKEKVERILTQSRQARNSDRHLLIAYMQAEGMELTPEQVEIFTHMASLETVRRIRQKLQEDGKYLADQSVKQERDFKSHQMEQTMPGSTPADVERIMENTFNIKAVHVELD